MPTMRVGTRVKACQKQHDRSASARCGSRVQLMVVGLGFQRMVAGLVVGLGALLGFHLPSVGVGALQICEVTDLPGLAWPYLAVLWSWMWSWSWSWWSRSTSCVSAATHSAEHLCVWQGCACNCMWAKNTAGYQGVAAANPCRLLADTCCGKCCCSKESPQRLQTTGAFAAKSVVAQERERGMQKIKATKQAPLVRGVFLDVKDWNTSAVCSDNSSALATRRLAIYDSSMCVPLYVLLSLSLSLSLGASRELYIHMRQRHTCTSSCLLRGVRFRVLLLQRKGAYVA